MELKLIARRNRASRHRSLCFCSDDLARLGNRGTVKPPLATASDQAALWENMDIIDCFATDHAPHLPTEKDGENSPPGFPSLETMVPLLLNAVHEGRLTLDQLREKLCDNPRGIFGLPEQLDTYVEVDLDEEWVIPERLAWSKAGWTPFVGMTICGKIHRVVLRGEDAFIDGHIIAQPGFGQNVRNVNAETETMHKPFDIIPPTKKLSSPEVTDSNGPRKKLPELPPISVDLAEDTYPDSILKFDRNRTYSKSAPISTRRRISFFAEESQEKTAGSMEKRPVSVSVKQPAAGRRQSLAVDFGLTGGEGGGDTTGRRGSVMPTNVSTMIPFHRLIFIESFQECQILQLFSLARFFKNSIHKNRPVQPILAGKLLANLFYDSDAISQNGYASAMQRLGGSVIYMNPSTSSVQKGESLRDTVTIMAGYSDIVVLRQSHTSTLEVASWCGAKPFINAGDASGEDLTQALVDVFTIWDEIGTARGLVVTLVGNLKNGASVHSLAKLLAVCHIAELRYVTPTNCEIPEDILNYIAEFDIPQKNYPSLEEALPETNVLYMAPGLTDPKSDQKRRFSLTPNLMTLAKAEGRTGPKLRILHPLPRMHEIAPELDTDPRAAYFRQGENGLYVRMALLAALLKGNPERRQSDDLRRQLNKTL